MRNSATGIAPGEADVGPQHESTRMTKSEKFESHIPAHTDLDMENSACELLALVMADKRVHTLIGRHHFPGLQSTYTSRRDSRIIKLLIEIAASYRLTSWRLTGEDRTRETKKDVGLLFGDDDNSETSLSMHEACNKIIHADEILFETRKVPKASMRHMDEQIQAWGKQKGKEWCAVIWIPEFCESSWCERRGCVQTWRDKSC